MTTLTNIINMLWILLKESMDPMLWKTIISQEISTQVRKILETIEFSFQTIVVQKRF